jgi:hypothetical protein
MISILVSVAAGGLIVGLLVGVIGRFLVGAEPPRAAEPRPVAEPATAHRRVLLVQDFHRGRRRSEAA